jgi:hypothetical protein
MRWLRGLVLLGVYCWNISFGEQMDTNILGCWRSEIIISFLGLFVDYCVDCQAVE